jgi:hypothetical protein
METLMAEKILWVVGYDSLNDFVQKSVDVGVTGVAIRTDNDLNAAIAAFHQNNIKVYGWRWPSAQRAVCMGEAQRIVGLLGGGLDGYFVDPEGAPGKPYDWNQNGLDGLASDFCDAITSAAPDKPFGVTSHYKARAVFPNLPWATFFQFSSVLLPQAYWRSSEGVIGHGNPAENYQVALTAWANAGGDPAKIVPMAGELKVSQAGDIDAYVAAAQAHNIGTLHFYTYEDGVPGPVWDAVANADVNVPVAAQ